MTDPFIPLSAPRFGPEVEELVLQVLRSGQIAQGPMVARFEELCAAMAGADHAVAVSNGTVALQAALEVAGVGPGAEVITSPMTFSATLNVILRRGAVARFADVLDDYTIDPASVASLINERTRAIMPVHLYGLMADMPALMRVAAAQSLQVIEDAAQAHGATLEGRRAGSWGLAGFSFYATKNVTSAEGGVVTTANGEWAQRLRVLRNQGMQSRYDYVMAGENWRLTDLQAAVAIPQLQRLEEITAARRRNAACLDELLGGIEGLRTPMVPPGREHVYHQYTVALPGGCDRDAVISGLQARGIGAGVYYPRLVWDYACYREDRRVHRDPTPRAAALVSRILSLPVHPGVGENGCERIAAALRDALSQADAPSSSSP